MAGVGVALAGAAGVVALLFASILLVARRESDAARALALVLGVEGALHLGAAIPPLVDEAGLLLLPRAADVVFLAALIATAPTYLLLLAELPSRFARPLRARARGLRILLVASLFAGLALAILLPGAAFALGALGRVGISVYSLVVAVDALRATAAGTAMRARASAFLFAFGVRDALYVLAVLAAASGALPGAALVLAAAATLAYVPLLATALVRTDLFLLAPRRREAPALPPRFRNPARVGRRTWDAHDREAGSRVVVKEVASAASATLEAGRLASPRLPRLVDVATHDGRVLAVFEHAPGRTLAAALEDGPLAPDEAARLARDLCEALRALHAAGLVHADVKPANVVLGEAGATLVDLGACRRAGEPGGEPGTPRYMAPEVARGDAPDARADVYGAALCVWEALRGEPFLGRGGDAMDARMRAAYPPPYRRPAGAPDALDAWLRRALDPERDARFDDAHVARAALDQRS